MKTQKLIYFVLLNIIFSFCNSKLYSQDLETLIKYADTHQYEKLREALTNLSGEEKETAAALYLKALIEKDADKAMVLYSHIIETDSKSFTYVKSLWRVGQYYYIKGLYVKSSDIFQKIIKEFPNSLYAKRSKDQLKIIRNVYGDKIKPAAPIPEKIIRPAEKPVKKSTATSSQPVKAAGKYTLQFGAFGNKKNADKRQKYLIKSGYKNTRIKSEVIMGRSLHRVWIGDFIDRDSARKVGELIKRKLKIDYSIKERE